MRQPMIAFLAVALVLAQGALAPLAGKVMCLAAAQDRHEHADGPCAETTCAAGQAARHAHHEHRWPRVHEATAFKAPCTHQDSGCQQKHVLCAAHDECSCHVHVPLPQLKAGLHHAAQDMKPLMDERPTELALALLADLAQPWTGRQALVRHGPGQHHAGCTAQVASLRTTRLQI